LPPAFVVINSYVVAQPASFDFSALFFALESYSIVADCPVIVLGDFNAHVRVPAGQIPNPRDRDFREFVL
jgi:hypothetical protein